MLRYTLRRATQSGPLLIGISLIAFLLLQAIPGGPTAAYRGTATVTADDLARIERDLGLDRPILIQYGLWLGKFVTGDWGVSFVARRPVLDLIAERLPATMWLMAAALGLSILIAVPVGVVAAIRRGRWLDNVITGASFVGLSLPAFWLGLMLIVIFTVWLGWLPGGGIGPPGVDPDLPTRLRYLILPTVTLATVSTGFFSRYLRAAVIDVLSRDHIAFLRAKGVSRSSLYLKHGLRSAAIPFVTVVAIHIPEYLVGTVVVETIFAWPGIGRLFWESAARFDYPVLMGVLVLGALLVVGSNLIADLLYGVLDPRVRYD